MKILAIGDIHGLNTWREIVKKEEFDMCVFVGDYFDSFDISTDEQIANFEAIIEFKKANMDKVTLLMGNHDMHYLIDESYSGFQYNRLVDIMESLTAGLPYIQKAYEADGFLFTHAGVTKTWVDKFSLDESDIVNEINALPEAAFGFSKDEPYDPYGDSKHQGCMWVRPKSLRKDMIEGYTHVVGHTKQKTIILRDNLALIDSLWNNNYITIEDGEINIKHIEYYEG